MQTFVVRYGTFFAHASTTTTTITSIRTRTPRTTTNFLLGPLSIARGQKASFRTFELSSRSKNGFNLSVLICRRAKSMKNMNID